MTKTLSMSSAPSALRLFLFSALRQQVYGGDCKEAFIQSSMPEKMKIEKSPISDNGYQNGYQGKDERILEARVGYQGKDEQMGEIREPVQWQFGGQCEGKGQEGSQKGGCRQVLEHPSLGVYFQ
jgi:hypothetical protein